jgi:alpha-D-ribose 1-methylphosphonate 5-triphosphate synthase subunit PhnI
VYATLQIDSEVIGLARALAATATEAQHIGSALIEQVCAESGVWAPDAAGRALDQSGGDIAKAVTLVRVWAATLRHLPLESVEPADVGLLRRLSAAFTDVPGGQWLGPTAEFDSRLLRWDDELDDSGEDPPSGETRNGATDDADPDPASIREPARGSEPGSQAARNLSAPPEAPVTRAAVPRVRDLLADVPVLVVPDEGPGPDPTRVPVVPPVSRGHRLAAFARAETGALVALCHLALATRQEAVLAELIRGLVAVRVPHPRTGRPCQVAEVPVTEAEVVLDADVDGRPGFALGWGATLGGLERRAVAAAVLDGALQDRAASGGDGGLPDDLALLAAVDGLATTGFVEHLRLPHYASFASYLARVGHHGEAGGDGGQADEEFQEDAR